LLGRPGAESFARAWDAAIAFAREARAAPKAPRTGLPGGLDEIWVPRTYRGRLIGYVVREDISGAMAKLAALDRIAERIGAYGSDAVDFEEMVALIAAGRGAEIDKIDRISRANASTPSISGVPFQNPHPNR
jgi:hypothetical protein